MLIEKAREKFREKNYICFTCDLDWAPEAAINMLLDAFINNGIRPTVFVTHNSHVVEQYQDRIDLGIHPNFIQPSSQGTNETEIIDYCMKLVPNTKVFRCHRWYASNDVYDKLSALGLKYESNLCTDMDLVEPFVHRSGMVSFPTFFEDGAYIISRRNMNFSEVREAFEGNGLKVINIHPMHYALNTPYFTYTRNIKDSLSREEWNQMNEITLDKMTYNGVGIRSFLEELMSYAKGEQCSLISLRDAYEMCEVD